jgi:phosphatidylinositol glycan class V
MVDPDSGFLSATNPDSGVSSASAILLLATLSRLATVLLAALSRWLAPPYDASPALPPGEALAAPLAALASWDAQHFLRLARGGYALEQLHAFFPLFPLLVARGADALQPLLPRSFDTAAARERDREAALALAALLISNASFVLAARLLLELGRLVLGDEEPRPRTMRSHSRSRARVRAHANTREPGAALAAPLPVIAAALFCVCPSGVFMSAAYSESLFAALSFGGMVAAERAAAAARGRAIDACGFAALWLCAATAAFALAAATRSNGAVLAGYIAFAALRIARGAGAGEAAGGGSVPQPKALPLVSLAATSAALVGGALLCAIVILPLLAFELLGRWSYCAVAPSWAHALAEAALPRAWGGLPTFVPAPAPTWCSRASLLYARVQSSYWGVGLLRYWQLKHAGMFVLAAPALLLAALAARRFCSGEVAAAAARGLRHLLLGGSAGSGVGVGGIGGVGGVGGVGGGVGGVGGGELKVEAAAMAEEVASAEAKAEVEANAALRELPYALHAAVLALVALLAMHVQVATRLLVAGPALFWAAARLTRTRPRLVLAVFLSYSCVGTALFAAHYNWT